MLFRTRLDCPALLEVEAYLFSAFFCVTASPFARSCVREVKKGTERRDFARSGRDFCQGEGT